MKTKLIFPVTVISGFAGELPDTTAKVITLHYEEGKTFKEIATIIDKSISIVYNHHHRGLYLLEKFSKQEQANS